MQTRMNRYHGDDSRSARTEKSLNRSTQNKELYEKVIDVDPFDANNKIDLTKLEKIIGEDEEPKKDYKDLLKINTDVKEDLKELERDLDRTFDINKIISQVKEGMEISNKPERDLSSIDTLDMTDALPAPSNETKDNEVAESPEEQLQDLFNTITTNSLISKDVPTSELALDVLSDLKPTDDSGEVTPSVKDSTVDTAPFDLSKAKPITEIMNESKEDKDLSIKAEEFFTGNIDFKDADFDDFSDLESAVKSSNKLLYFLIFILLIVLAGVGFYIHTTLFT